MPSFANGIDQALDMVSVIADNMQVKGLRQSVPGHAFNEAAKQCGYDGPEIPDDAVIVLELARVPRRPVPGNEPSQFSWSELPGKALDSFQAYLSPKPRGAGAMKGRGLLLGSIRPRRLR